SGPSNRICLCILDPGLESCCLWPIPAGLHDRSQALILAAWIAKGDSCVARTARCGGNWSLSGLAKKRGSKLPNGWASEFGRRENEHGFYRIKVWDRKVG